MIDRYDAPEGMVAVRGQVRYACTGCSFNTGRCSFNTGRINCDIKCNAEERDDETEVIFITRADFEKMLMQEIEKFYGKGKVKRIIFTKDNIKQDITQKL